MKKLIIPLLLAASSLHAEPERIIIANEKTIEYVQQLLNDGWTVKHQSITYDRDYTKTIIVFTLTPPTKEVRDELERKRKEEFAKKREEFLRKQEESKKVEK